MAMNGRPTKRFLSSEVSPSPSTRRKKVGVSRGGEPVSVVDFGVEIGRVLNQIYRAIDVGIMPVNTEYKLMRSMEGGHESISLDAGEKGYYIFSVDWKMERLTVQTPISGIRQYEYEPSDDTWLNTVDRHDMRGLVTRDLLRHSRGCPSF